MLAQQFINAVSLGGVYALFALGFTLVFGVLGVLNLAHGAVFTVGAYAALQAVVLLRLPLPAAILIAMLITGATGWLLDKLTSPPCGRVRRRTWRR
jgi:branched-chain amino acid transport system permease protein